MSRSVRSSWDIPPTRPSAELQDSRHGSSWDHPSTRSDPARMIKMDPPHFNGSDVTSWISRVQYFFDHIGMPIDHRLHYVVMLFDPPAAEWIFNYREANGNIQWADFLEDVRRKFDPKYFVNFMGLIAKLCQTGTLADFNSEFEEMWKRLRGVPDYILLPVYIEGLQEPVKHQVKFQHPSSVAAAIALAQEFDSALPKPAIQTAPRRNWQQQQPRDQRYSGGSSAQGQTAGTTAPNSGRRINEISRLPVVRLSTAEKAERTRLGLCWYCPEKWITGHVCKRNFLAYMGLDDVEDEDERPVEPIQAQEVITADLSHIYAMEGRHRPDAIELQGLVGNSPVRVLVDTGSSHDFLHPRIAELLKLPLKAIRPFRVMWGTANHCYAPMLA